MMIDILLTFAIAALVVGIAIERIDKIRREEP